MKISEKIQALRKKKGLSQENLANMLGISRQAVFKWEAGESTPDIDNIKKLSEIFEVSFDLLLNDKIDSIEEEKKDDVEVVNNNEPFKYRKAFASNESMLSADHTDLDYGYFQKRKYKYNASTYLDNETKITNEGHTKYGFQKYMMVVDNSLIYFFDDSNKKAFGFMCNEAIQLYVPYENLIDVQILDNGGKQKVKYVHNPSVVVGSIFGVGVESNPIVVNEKASIYTINISFFDENGEIKSKRFGFSTYCFYDSMSIPVNDVESTHKIRGMQIVANLNKIKTLLIGIKEIGTQIREKRISVTDDMIDFDFEKQVSDWKARREELKNKAYQDFLVDKKKARNKKLIKIGIVAALFIAFFIWAVIAGSKH